jgi:uncharacterized phage-associated protein
MKKSLPTKLEAVLLRLGSTAALNITQAVKLPYLVDVVAKRVLGAPITEGIHQAWDHGVVTSQVWHYLSKRDDSPTFHLEPVPFSEERKLIVDENPLDDALTADEKAVVDFVAAQFRVLNATDLGRMTKLMNPAISSWGTNQRASIEADAFERMSDDYQAMAEQVAALTLEGLRRNFEPVTDIEEAIA